MAHNVTGRCWAGGAGCWQAELLGWAASASKPEQSWVGLLVGLG